MFKKRENVFDVEEGKFFSPKFDDNGLIPVTTTDSGSGELLMHGFMNAEALKKTIEKQISLTFDSPIGALLEPVHMRIRPCSS